MEYDYKKNLQHLKERYENKINQEQGLDKEYNKYIKRVRNRKKLYEKLKKIGRRIK